VKRRALTLVVLGAAVVVLAGVGAVVARHPWGTGAAAGTAGVVGSPGAPGGPAAPMKFVQISQVSQDLLRSIELVGSAGTITLGNARGSWQIVKPALLGVRKAPMDDLLYSLANLVSERVIEESPHDPGIYGLDPPVVTVRMTLTTGEVRELYLGDMTPAGDTYYLRAEGDPRVFTVREHHGTYFHYGIRELWEGAFTPLDGTTIASLRLRRAGKLVVELKKTPELSASDLEFRGTTLSVIYPYATSPRPADGSFLGRFAQALASLQSSYAVDAGPTNLVKYGLDAPVAELEMSDAGGKALHLFIGKEDGQVLFVRFERDPTVYAADPNLLSLIAADPFQFISKYAAIVKIDTVDRLTFETGAAKHVLEIRRAAPDFEEGAQWLVDSHAVAEKTFKDFYVAAVSLQIDSLHDGAAVGEPALTMTFGLNRGPVRSLVVRFVPWSQEFYAVTKNSEGDILVNRQQVKALLQSLDALAGAAAKGN
jgi:hypothetical protein